MYINRYVYIESGGCCVLNNDTEETSVSFSARHGISVLTLVNKSLEESENMKPATELCNIL